MIRNLRLGLPPLGEHRSSWELEDHLNAVPSPERGTDRNVELATELSRLVPAGGAKDLADTAARYGLAGLRAAVAPPENVLPFRRPTRP